MSNILFIRSIDRVSFDLTSWRFCARYFWWRNLFNIKHCPRFFCHWRLIAYGNYNQLIYQTNATINPLNNKPISLPLFALPSLLDSFLDIGLVVEIIARFDCESSFSIETGDFGAENDSVVPVFMIDVMVLVI